MKCLLFYFLFSTRTLLPPRWPSCKIKANISRSEPTNVLTKSSQAKRIWQAFTKSGRERRGEEILTKSKGCCVSGSEVAEVNFELFPPNRTRIQGVLFKSFSSTRMWLIILLNLSASQYVRGGSMILHPASSPHATTTIKNMRSLVWKLHVRLHLKKRDFLRCWLYIESIIHSADGVKFGCRVIHLRV